MKKYILTLRESTDRKRSVRISISYFSLTRTGSPRIYDRVYVRLGPLVVSMYNLQGEKLLRTVQDMLTVTPAFLVYINKFLSSDPSDASVLSSRFHFLRTILTPIHHLSLTSKMAFLFPLTEKLYISLAPGRISIPFSRSLPTMFTLLVKSYADLLLRYQDALTSRPRTES